MCAVDCKLDSRPGDCEAARIRAVAVKELLAVMLYVNGFVVLVKGRETNALPADVKLILRCAYAVGADVNDSRLAGFHVEKFLE